MGWWPRPWTTLGVGLVVAFVVILIAWYRPSAKLLAMLGVVLALLVVAGWRMHRKRCRSAAYVAVEYRWPRG